MRRHSSPLLSSPHLSERRTREFIRGICTRKLHVPEYVAVCVCVYFFSLLFYPFCTVLSSHRRFEQQWVNYAIEVLFGHWTIRDNSRVELPSSSLVLFAVVMRRENVGNRRRKCEKWQRDVEANRGGVCVLLQGEWSRELAREDDRE